jgi:peptidoglycan/LPS O-acetylase OafA/YrhL
MPENQTPPNRTLVDSLTGVRGAACLLVILCHDTALHGRGNGSLIVAGSTAVLIFFVLSAYLLTKNMLKEIGPKKDQPPRTGLIMILVNYLIKRFIRIYPAFATYVIINHGLIVYYGPTSRYAADSPDSLWHYLKFGLVFNHLWTIRIEMIFYCIVLPIFAILASLFLNVDYKYLQNSRFKTFYLFLVTFTLTIAHTVYKTHVVNGVNYVNLYFLRDDFYKIFPIFGYGVLAGTLAYYLQPYQVRLDTRLKKAVCEISLYSILVYIYFANDVICLKYLGHNERVWWQELWSTAVMVAISFVILEKVGTQCSIGRFFSNGLMVWMGKCSYSVYLVHYSTIFWLDGHIQDLTTVDGALIVVLGAFFVGNVLFHLVEEPCFKLAKYATENIRKYANHIFKPKTRRIFETSSANEEVELYMK